MHNRQDTQKKAVFSELNIDDKFIIFPGSETRVSGEKSGFRVVHKLFKKTDTDFDGTNAMAVFAEKRVKVEGDVEVIRVQ